MDARSEAAAAINTSTFEPSSDLIQEEDCNTLLLYLPGFTKEQLRVQLTRTRVLKISGTRPLINNRWSSFQKDFPVPENCDTNKITAKFEDGILYVRQPKDEKKLTAAEAPPPQKPAEEQRLPAAKIDPPLPRPPTPIRKTAQTSGDIKQTAPPKDSPTKPFQSKEEIKSAEETSGREKEEKRHRAAEKSGGSGGGDEKAAAAAMRAAEKRDKGRGSSGDKVEADYNKLSAASPAARLKDARKKMTNILLLLCAFALGIYVSKLPWFSKSAGD